MTGAVHVLELSKPLPHTQSFYDDEAEAQRRALLSDADHEDEEEGDPASHAAEHQVVVSGGEISTNAGGASTLSIMRFVSHTAIIHAGQTGPGKKWGIYREAARGVQNTSSDFTNDSISFWWSGIPTTVML